MKILSVGHCTLDHFALVERFLEEDQKVQMSQFSVQGGGSAATAAATLARWGAEVAFVGKVGADERGGQIESTLTGEGVDCSAMVVDPEGISQFSFMIIEEEHGRKRTLYTQGSVQPLIAEEVSAGLLDGVQMLLVDGQQPDAQVALCRAAGSRGIDVIFDASVVRARAAELLELCDLVIASERFASEFTGVGQLGSICEALLGLGPSEVLVTLGDEGVVGASEGFGRLMRADAFGSEVVDTTGAGDIFFGATAFARSNGWCLERAMRFANAAAGLSCREVGGRGGIPAIATVLRGLGEA